jgi:hypothetical protein
MEQAWAGYELLTKILACSQNQQKQTVQSVLSQEDGSMDLLLKGAAYPRGHRQSVSLGGSTAGLWQRSETVEL